MSASERLYDMNKDYTLRPVFHMIEFHYINELSRKYLHPFIKPSLLNYNKVVIGFRTFLYTVSWDYSNLY